MGEFPQGSYSYFTEMFLQSPAQSPPIFFFNTVKVCGLNLLQDAYIEQVGSSPHVNGVGGQTDSLYFYCKVKEVQ